MAPAPILDAVKNDDNERLRELLYEYEHGHSAGTEEARAAVNQRRHPSGKTPLIMAVVRGNVEATNMLLSLGASISATCNGQHQDVVSACARGGSVECAELLLAAGAKFTGPDANGCTPAHHASGNGNTRMLRWLASAHVGASIEEFMPVGGTPLAIALRESITPCVRALLDLGASVRRICRSMANPSHALPDKDALHIAALHGNSDIVQMVIARIKKTPGHLEALNSAKYDGWRAIHLASVNLHFDVLDQLITAGADVDAVIQDTGATPLHLACMARGDNECEAAGIVRLLLRAGAKVERSDSKGRTPLHFAVKRNHTGALQQLVDAGADVNAKTAKGKTPRAYAEATFNERAMQILHAKSAPSAWEPTNFTMAARHSAASRATQQQQDGGMPLHHQQLLELLFTGTCTGGAGAGAGAHAPEEEPAPDREPGGRPKRQRK